MKRLSLGILALFLFCGAVAAFGAEDVAIIDAFSAAGTVEVSQGYICVTCRLEQETDVTVTVRDAKGSLCYQRDYGSCSGDFRSEDVFLRLKGSSTPYRVELSANGAVYGFDVLRKMPYLSDNLACSVGYPLSELTGRDTWKTVTLLDTGKLEENQKTVPLYASGAYEIGTVTFSISDNQLKVSASLMPGLDGSVGGGKVYVALNAADARDLDGRRFSGLTGRLNSAVDLKGARYAVVYVELIVSFDPSGASAAPEAELSDQAELWQSLIELTANEAVG